METTKQTNTKIEIGDWVQYKEALSAYVTKIHPVCNKVNIVGPHRTWSRQRVSMSELTVLRKNQIYTRKIEIGHRVIMRSFVRRPDLSKKEIGLVDKIHQFNIHVNFKSGKSIFRAFELAKITVIKQPWQDDLAEELYERAMFIGSPGEIIQIGEANPVFLKLSNNKLFKSLSAISLNE